jgi:bifunctional non-homologous end joining protein LigD
MQPASGIVLLPQETGTSGVASPELCDNGYMREYIVPSDRTDEEYTVSVGGRRNTCTCIDFKTRQRDCKHVRRVLDSPKKFRLVGEPAILTPAAMTAQPLPMLAKPFKHKITPGRFAVEEKFDGHRLIVRVARGKSLKAWSRTGKDNLAKLSATMRKTLSEFPSGVYDGELVNRSDPHSYGVSHLQAKRLTFVVFDVLEIGDTDAAHQTYDKRRTALEMLFEAYEGTPSVELAPKWLIDTQAELDAKVEEIWEREGEGVIVKRRDAIYHEGRRTDAFLKIKDVKIATTKIIGFVETKGEVLNRGFYAMAVVQDAEGNSTTVKTLDDATIARLEKVAPKLRRLVEHRMNSGKKVEMTVNHPFVGKGLLIEYHERTPDASYRHPRWDRLEEE